MQEVYVFWDNSNMFHSAQQVASRNDGIMAKDAARISFANLMNLAKANRQVKKAVAVGSVPPKEQDLWRRMESDTGIKIELYERGGVSGKEQGVDQCLQTHMLRALADENTPKVAILLTGDGKGYEEGIGFLADMQRLHEKGWGVEVISWEHSCKPELRAWAEKNGTFISLDKYYNSITFIQGGRTVSPLSLTSRQKSNPRLTTKDTLTAENEKLREELKKRDEAKETKKQRQKKYGDHVNKRKKRR